MTRAALGHREDTLCYPEDRTRKIVVTDEYQCDAQSPKRPVATSQPPPAPSRQNSVAEIAAVRLQVVRTCAAFGPACWPATGLPSVRRVWRLLAKLAPRISSFRRLRSPSWLAGPAAPCPLECCLAYAPATRRSHVLAGKSKPRRQSHQAAATTRPIPGIVIGRLANTSPLSFHRPQHSAELLSTKRAIQGFFVDVMQQAVDRVWAAYLAAAFTARGSAAR